MLILKLIIQITRSIGVHQQIVNFLSALLQFLILHMPYKQTKQRVEKSINERIYLLYLIYVPLFIYFAQLSGDGAIH